MTKSTAHDAKHAKPDEQAETDEHAVASAPDPLAGLSLADLERDLAHVDAQLATVAGLPQYATEARAFRDRREALQAAIAAHRP